MYLVLTAPGAFGVIKFSSSNSGALLFWDVVIEELSMSTFKFKK